MQSFLIGLGIGLIVALVILIVMAVKQRGVKREMKQEVEKYKRMLTDRMELENDGLNKVRADNEDLRKANENLRVSLMALRDKPGRKEIQQLQIMQKTVERLTMTSPGFAPIWQQALKETEEEFSKVYSGFSPFVKRHTGRSTDTQLATIDTDDEN